MVQPQYRHFHSDWRTPKDYVSETQHWAESGTMTVVVLAGLVVPIP